MLIVLAAFCVFDLLLAAAASGLAARLMTPDAAAEWNSPRLLTIARASCWCLAATAAAAPFAAGWLAANEAAHWALPAALSPIALLVIAGVGFALADVAEDGVLNFSRSRPDG